MSELASTGKFLGMESKAIVVANIWTLTISKILELNI